MRDLDGVAAPSPVLDLVPFGHGGFRLPHPHAESGSRRPAPASRTVAIARADDVAGGQPGGLGVMALIAAAFGIVIDRYYRDEESILDGQRPGTAMRDVLSDARDGCFDAVVVSGMATLGSGMLEALANVHALRRLGVTVFVGGLGPITAGDLLGLPL